MKDFLKKTTFLAAVSLVAPFVVLFFLGQLLIGKERTFPGWSQFFGLIPGTTGVYLRRAFYWWVLPRVGQDSWVSFGTVFSHPTAQIGERVYIGIGCMIGDVTLEEDVLIGSHVSIINGNRQHGIERLDIPVREQPGEYPRVTIGRDSWIGDRAIVMADVGKHAVVGAGSVVTKPVPDYAIVVGNPARVIGQRGGNSEEQLGFSVNNLLSELVKSMSNRIPFNKPFIVGKELYYIAQAVTYGNISGDGYFTKASAKLMEDRFGVPRILLTPSCTAALEMAAILLDLQPGDEVIMPSYTFVSTATAFVRLGAKPVFVDIRPDTLNIDDALIEEAITPRTKAIVPVHYAGVGCEMDRIMTIADKYGLIVVEDAAQGVNAFYDGRALGSIGHLGCYSFHETKNYICGEGGALCINDDRFRERAEIIRDKGTNRQKFFRGEVDKYTWVDVGSSYVPSEICSAFLYAQLEMLDEIAVRRREIYWQYWRQLKALEDEQLIRLPQIPEECRSNFHMFYVLLATAAQRDALLAHLKPQGIHAVFHYVPLHTSPMGRKLGYRDGDLPVTEELAARLVRLPMYYEISPEEQSQVVESAHGIHWNVAATEYRVITPSLVFKSRKTGNSMSDPMHLLPDAIRPLEWDSEHFGFPVARIEHSDCTEKDLATFLELAKRAGIRLLYCFRDEKRMVSQVLLDRYMGSLVDHRVTFGAVFRICCPQIIVFRSLKSILVARPVLNYWI